MLRTLWFNMYWSIIQYCSYLWNKYKQLYMCTTESSNQCSKSCYNQYRPTVLQHKTVAGLIALPSTHSSSSQSWHVGIKATPSCFVANSWNFSSHSASVLQCKDEFHRPVGCAWPEIRLDITGCSFQAKFQVGWSPFLFRGRFTLG